MSGSPRVVLITGCSSPGVSAAMAEQFARSGCIVYALARNIDKVSHLSPAVHRTTCDLSRDDSVTNAVQEIVNNHGKIDVLVNNSNAGQIGPLLDIPMETFQKTFESGILATLRLIKAVVPHMASRKRGIIVNVGSMTGQIATPWGGSYSSTKSTLHSLTDTLDMELRPLGIHVMLLVPGLLSSNMDANQTHPSIPSGPEKTLYERSYQHVSTRLGFTASAGTTLTHAMSTEDFATETVREILNHRPRRYMSIGGSVWRTWILTYIPRWLVLSLFSLHFFKLPALLDWLRPSGSTSSS